MDAEETGTAEGLVEELRAAGLGPNQARVWVTSPSALLSGLVPGEAITDPATAGRARAAVRRLIARLGDRVPDDVKVAAAAIREPGTYLLELTFSSSDGIAVRHWDAAPYLWASRAHDVLLSDYTRFARLYVDNGILFWPGGLQFAPAFLFAESWSATSSAEG